MTVKELIEKLKEFDEELEIVCEGLDIKNLLLVELANSVANMMAPSDDCYIEIELDD